MRQMKVGTPRTCRNASATGTSSRRSSTRLQSLCVATVAARRRPEFLARAFARQRAACEPAEQFALYSGRVAFLLVPHVDVAAAMRAAAEHLATHWKGLLSFAAEDEHAQAPDGHGRREIVLDVH